MDGEVEGGGWVGVWDTAKVKRGVRNAHAPFLCPHIQTLQPCHLYFPVHAVPQLKTCKGPPSTNGESKTCKGLCLSNEDRKLARAYTVPAGIENLQGHIWPYK